MPYIKARRNQRSVLSATAIFGACLLVAVSGWAAATGSSDKANLFTSDFGNSTSAWTVVSGTFQVANGAYCSQALEENTKLSRVVVGDKSWRDYRMTARIKLEQTANPNADFGVLFRYQDKDDYFMVLYKVEAKKFTVEEKINGKLQTVAASAAELESGKWHDFQITVTGQTMTTMVDDKPVIKSGDISLANGMPGLLAYYANIQCSRFDVAPVAAP